MLSAQISAAGSSVLHLRGAQPVEDIGRFFQVAARRVKFLAQRIPFVCLEGKWKPGSARRESG